MGKKILIGFAAILLIGMTAYSIYNLNTLSTQKKAITSKSQQVSKLIKTLDQEKLENEILVDKNIELETKIVELRDSISMLKYELTNLKSSFANNKNEILVLKDIIAAHESKYAALQSEISQLNTVAQSNKTIYEQVAIAETPAAKFTTPDFGKGGLEYAIAFEEAPLVSNDIILTAKGPDVLTVSRELIEEQELVQKERDMALAKIKRLEEESQLLKEELDSLYALKTEKLIETKAIKEVIVERTESEKNFQKLASIVNQTMVNFNKISVRKARYGKQIPKVSGRNWKYTVIELGLDGVDPSLLMEGSFMIKILDRDKNSVVTYLEANPNYPYNTIEKDGVEATFDGNLIEVVHHNNFKKSGKNFDLIVNFVDASGEEYTLLNGVKQFINNGVPVTE